MADPMAFGHGDGPQRPSLRPQRDRFADRLLLRPGAGGALSICPRAAIERRPMIEIFDSYFFHLALEMLILDY